MRKNIEPPSTTSGALTPGLVWRARANGRKVPYWCARDARFKPRSVNLAYLVRDLDERSAQQLLAVKCQELNARMRVETEPKLPTFDGTVKGMLDVYELHPMSSFQKLKPTSKRLYAIYLRILRENVGHNKLVNLTGLDLRDWHATWRISEDGSDMLPRATTMIAIMKAAITFGKEAGFNDCIKLHSITHGMEFEKPKPRDQAPTAADIDAARRAAHGLGAHSAALAYALQFDGQMRQYDVIGIWVDLSDKRPSSIIDRGEKWSGPTWADIDERMILTYTPYKTERTTGRRVHVDLSECPMVMEELARVPIEQRSGPLIVSETTGLPYRPFVFGYRLWHRVRKEAGLSALLWNRDIRAGAITEGGIAGASMEDRAKLAGHATPRTTAQVYDRDTLEAARRVSRARSAHREAKG